MKNTAPSEVLISRRKRERIVWLLFVLAGSCAPLSSGPPIRTPMPCISAEDLAGNPRLISKMDAPCILFFYKPSCRPCNRLLEVLQSCFGNKPTSWPSLLLLVQREQKHTLATKELAGLPVFLISQNAWYNEFKVSRTPILLFYQAEGLLLRKQCGWRSNRDQAKILNDFVLEVLRTAQRTSPPLLRLSLQVANELYAHSAKS